MTAIDTKILITLMKSKQGFLNTDEILLQTGIATSTWSAEQSKLVTMGLMKKRMVRIIERDYISKRMNYGLTEKGKDVGANLLNIFKILTADSKEQVATSGSILVTERHNDDFANKLGECIEVALESFGSNLVYLVRKSFEVEHKISWDQLPDKSGILQQVLRDYFGLRASEKLEKLIAANIRSRFEIGNLRSEDLTLLIAEARKRNSRDLEIDDSKVNSKIAEKAEN